MRRIIHGNSASNGTAVGPAFIFNPQPLTFYRRNDCIPNIELQRLDQVIQRAKDELTRTIDTFQGTDHGEMGKIIAGQRAFLDDPEFMGAIRNIITENKVNAEAAISDIAHATRAEFESIESDYLRERIADVNDITDRLLALLLGIERLSLHHISEPSVIVAVDLMPSDTIRLNPHVILGLCTERGSVTSHTALLANALNIPAIVGCGRLNIEHNEMVLIDGIAQQIIVNPTDEEIRDAHAHIATEKLDIDTYTRDMNEPVYSADNHQYTISANIATCDDAKRAMEYGAEGVGLLRTEFLYYQQSSLPNAEAQLALYRDIAKQIAPHPLTIRTADFGGDKQLMSTNVATYNENNPFLGMRGVRFSLEQKSIFHEQLIALLQLSVHYPIRVMIPFISVIEEIKAVHGEITTLRNSMDIQAPLENFKVGVMIETPSAALLIEHICRMCDFISIGTNDLAQYVMAADRNNEQVSDLVDYCNPPVLLLIERVIATARRHQKEVSMCGEMASDPLLIPLLVGMGLKNYSMTASKIPHTKDLIRKLALKECAPLVAQCAMSASAAEVRNILKNFTP